MTSRDLLPALRAVRDHCRNIAFAYYGPDPARRLQSMGITETKMSAHEHMMALEDEDLLAIAEVEGEGETDGQAPAPVVANRAAEVTPTRSQPSGGPDQRSERIDPSPSPALIVAFGVAARQRSSWWRNPYPNDAWFLALWEQVKASQAKCDPEQLFYRHPGDASAASAGVETTIGLDSESPRATSVHAAQGAELPKRAECEGTGSCQYCGDLLHHWPSPEIMGWHERCAAAKARHDAFAQAVAFCEQSARDFDETYADKHADAARYIARGIRALAEEVAK